ncbi:hypothetical protein F5883DRAFT_553266 [Diaporthe sp. PMI_573]|nr:hypothetical protein F5883DRAFT_553266 [Diaporthaceae sp. PMI_573]
MLHYLIIRLSYPSPRPLSFLPLFPGRAADSLIRNLFSVSRAYLLSILFPRTLCLTYITGITRTDVELIQVVTDGLRLTQSTGLRPMVTSPAITQRRSLGPALWRLSRLGSRFSPHGRYELVVGVEQWTPGQDVAIVKAVINEFLVHLFERPFQMVCKLVDSVFVQDIGELFHHVLMCEILISDHLVVRIDELQRILAPGSLPVVLAQVASAVDSNLHGPGYRDDGKEANSLEEHLGVLILFDFDVFCYVSIRLLKKLVHVV